MMETNNPAMLQMAPMRFTSMGSTRNLLIPFPVKRPMTNAIPAPPITVKNARRTDNKSKLGKGMLNNLSHASTIGLISVPSLESGKKTAITKPMRL